MAIKILIIDDEPEMERLMLQQFRRKIRKGLYDCQFARNGEEALEFIQSQPETDILLCDINMPRMDGITFLSHLQESQTFAKPIMVSAYGNMDNIRKAMNGGAFDFVVKPIDFEDLETTIQKAMEEVNKLKKAEKTSQKLTAAEEETSYLRELDELKNRFFTHISHEFRTPLTVILGMAEQIQENPEKWQEKGLAMIRQNGSNLLDLINQLLELRKLEAGSLSANYVQGDIIAYLQYLVASFESLAELKGISLDFETKVESLMMDYDPDKLLRIVTNLISNAMKFTEEGGSVNVTVPSFEFRVSGIEETRNAKPETRNFLTFQVSDSGIGIPPEKLPHIFDSFYQVTENHPQEQQGTGIGLTLTQELVKLLDGEIGVESEPGKGSRFTITLPIHQNATDKEDFKQTIRLKDFQLSPSSKQLISSVSTPQEDLPLLLIAEDNPDVSQYLIACLEGQYRLILAKDGQEGIEMALEHIPDLIISDVMMPRKNGYELCEKLKNDVKSSHIPIVLLTANAGLDARIEGFTHGADAYLAKPFDKKELFVRLEQLNQLRRQLQARYQTFREIEQADNQPLSKEDKFILNIQEIIENRLMDTAFGIPDLCREIGMSRSQLHNKIKALTNRSTSLYIRFLRLSKARQLLSTSDLNVSEVAYQVGFNDPRYFSRTYTQEFGESPSQTK